MLKSYHIFRAQQRIRPHLAPTPLIHSPGLSDLSGADVWLKLETRQPTGSFKVRGALHKIIQLGDEATEKGVVTASAGNHGLGVAFAASRLGLTNVNIFVPKTTPFAKVSKLRRFPIQLHQVGQSYNDAHHAAEAFADQSGAIYLPAYDDLDVIAGAGTIGLEIINDLPTVETIIVPVGGGGMVAGIGVAIKGVHKAVKLIGVQPTASPSAKLSFKQNLPLEEYEAEETIADGLAGGFGKYPFYLSRLLIDEILLFDEPQIRQGVYTLLDREQMVVEGSAGISIAPLLHADKPFKDQTVVCMMCGSNIDTQLLAQILQEGQVAQW